MRKLKLESKGEWEAWSASGERPANIPGDPRKVYRDSGWVSTADWLGYEDKRGHYRELLPFRRARAAVRKLKLKSQEEWHAWSKSGARPANIPADPYRMALHWKLKLYGLRRNRKTLHCNYKQVSRQWR